VRWVGSGTCSSVLGVAAELGSHLLTVNDAQRLPGSESPALTCSELADAASSLSQAASSGTRPTGSNSAATIAAELGTATTTDTEWVPMDSKAAPTCSCWSPGDSVSSYVVNAEQLYF